MEHIKTEAAASRILISAIVKTKTPHRTGGSTRKRQSLAMKHSMSEHSADQEAVLSAVVLRVGTQELRLRL